MRPDLEALEAEARARFEAGRDLGAIMQLLLDRDSPIWFDAEGQRIPNAEVVTLPTYKTIKALAMRRGIEAGHLKADAQSSGLPFEAYLHVPGEKN